MSIQLNPKNIKSYERRGLGFEQLKQYINATNDFETILQTDKTHSLALKKIKELKNKGESETHYTTLGVTNKSNKEEIKKSFEKKRAENHPDKFTDEFEKNERTKIFIQIQEAYEVLKDEKKKETYDLNLLKESMIREAMKNSTTSSPKTESFWSFGMESSNGSFGTSPTKQSKSETSGKSTALENVFSNPDLNYIIHSEVISNFLTFSVKIFQ
jgi:DnaJ-class molecular chaperone